MFLDYVPQRRCFFSRPELFSDGSDVTSNRRFWRYSVRGIVDRSPPALSGPRIADTLKKSYQKRWQTVMQQAHSKRIRDLVYCRLKAAFECMKDLLFDANPYDGPRKKFTEREANAISGGG